MTAEIKDLPEQEKAWTEQLREGSRCAVQTIRSAVVKIEGEDQVMIYKFFHVPQDKTVEEFSALADLAEQFMMTELRNGMPEEILDKYVFAYLKNTEKREVCIGSRLKTEKDREDEAKAKAEKKESEETKSE